MTELNQERTDAAPVQRPNLLLSLVGAYICFVIASTGAMLLFEGLTAGDYGWVRGVGAVSLAFRPMVFVIVTVVHLVATFAAAWGMVALISRHWKRARTS